MAVHYLKPKEMNYPLELSEHDIKRIVAVVEGSLPQEAVSFEEMEAYQDLLYDTIAAKIQTHEGSRALQ
jgi:hypothetical protein